MKRAIEEFNEVIEYRRESDPNIEYLEVFDINGTSVFFKRGGEYGVELKEEELLEIKNNKGIIVIHNHPSLFNNMHSFDDLWVQLSNNFSYSIVESYTKRYIVVNNNTLSNESKQIILNKLEKDNREFKEKVRDAVETRLSLQIEGQNYDYFETEKIRNKIYDEVIIENMDYFESKISKYFDENTGLKIYVHDRVRV